MSDLSPRPGDVNGNGVVNQVDIAIIVENFGATNATRAQGDTAGYFRDPDNPQVVASAFTPDGVINSDDLTITAGNYAP
jgi:hypothetical protein